ncbi:PHD finger-like domain-containing protein 5B [Echinococcus granulosus]|uniref:PHD finger 5A n=1 Tax=Echinococcus granulosus TaxID=6210 RepID=A0A068WL32_ECHGR|nr:PHD finger-like domain-containing protein 5B [Echinococcus granulosus]CDS18379.1 PHD finger 5A [Echinococcus granulosus]
MAIRSFGRIAPARSLLIHFKLVTDAFHGEAPSGPYLLPQAARSLLCEKCDGKCVICDSYVRPCTLVRICDECNYGSYQGRCVICGGTGVSDAYYCRESPKPTSFTKGRNMDSKNDLISNKFTMHADVIISILKPGLFVIVDFFIV